jgi:hypothetical protein
MKNYYATVEHMGISFLVYIENGFLSEVNMAHWLSMSNKNLMKLLSDDCTMYLYTEAYAMEGRGEVEYV